MEIELKELLSSINSRFSGPESRRLYEMIIGKLDLNYEEIETYLRKLTDFGGANPSQKILGIQKDAKAYLVLYTDYLSSAKSKQS